MKPEKHVGDLTVFKDTKIDFEEIESGHRKEGA